MAAGFCGGRPTACKCCARRRPLAERYGCYCSGAILGGSKGAVDAIRTKPEVAVNSMRLRATQLLNMSGKVGCHPPEVGTQNQQGLRGCSRLSCCVQGIIALPCR